MCSLPTSMTKKARVLKINQYIFAVQLDWLWRRGTPVTQQQHMFIAKLALVPQLDYGPLKRRPN